MRRFHPIIPSLTAGLLVMLVWWQSAPPELSEGEPGAEATVLAKPSRMPASVRMPGHAALATAGRLERSTIAEADIELPGRADLQWREPVEEVAFEEFRRWTEAFLEDGNRADLELGIELAGRRREAMLEIIDRNPRRAINLAVPDSVRRRLPAGIVAQLEQRVDSHGDMLVQATTFEDGRSCSINRTVTLRDGRVFDARTYGRRGAIPTRDSIAIHGVALDGKLAVSDLPGRLIEPSEVAEGLARGVTLEECPQLRDPAHPHDADEEVLIAWGDSRMTRCCGRHHAAQTMAEAEAAEEAFAPMTEGGDLDGVIAYSPMTEGRKKLLIIRVDFPDFKGQVVGDATLQQLISDMNSVYSDMSFGKAGFALLGQGSAITPTVRLPNDSSYYTSFSRVLSAARTAAAAAGYNYLDYTYEVVVTGSKPAIPGTAGVAMVGARGAWLHNSQWNIRTCSHEVGHNFGLPHAGAWDTDDDSVIGTGEIWDYGNEFDIMGVGDSATSLRHFGSSFKEYLDWLPTADVVKITTNGSTTTRIRAMDKMQADGNKRALVVDRSGSSDDYWVEYRQLYGTSYGMRDGVLVNWASINGGYQQPLLLDMKPDTFEKEDAVLPRGRTFSDAAAGIHITPVARGTDGDGVAWMDVRVNRGTFAGNQKPTVTLASSVTNPAVNASVTLTATASDPNGDELAYFWDWGDGTTTANNSPTASKSWSSSGTKTVRCIVSDMKGLTTTASLLVQVGSSSSFFIQGVVSTSQGVPMQGVVVRASSTQSDTTDSEGYYAITGLAAGSYTLTATKTGATIQPGGFSNPVTVGPSQQGKNFLVQPGAPVFTATMKSAITDQGSNTGAIPLPLADADTDISLLTLAATSSNTGLIPNSSITFGTAGTARTITVSAASNVSGTVNITITATDPQGNSGSHVWPVTVNAKPVLSLTTPVTLENTPVDIDLRPFVSDDITADELIHYGIDRVQNGRVTLLPDGYTARFLPNPNFNGNATFRLVVRDQSLGPNFRFLYDFEPPDSHTDAVSTDKSNFNRNGTLQSINGGTYAYDASVPPVLAPQSARGLVLAQSGTSAARLRRTLATTDHNLNDADWTFSAWVWRGGTDTDDFVFHLGDGDGFGSENELQLLFPAGSDDLKLQKWGAAGLEKEIVCPDIPSNQWHHVTLSYDRTASNSGAFYLYVGRFLRGSVSGVVMNVSQAAPVVCGGHASTTSNVTRWFDGVMDEVLFQSGLSTRNEIFNRERIGARHFHGLNASGTVNVSVSGANQPPSIVVPPEYYIPVSATSSPVTVRLLDAETEARNLTLTASSSNQSLLPNGSITVSGAPPAWTASDIGNVTTAGSLTQTHGTFLVGGAGTGIGPAAGDSFRWVRQGFSGDAEMIARVVFMDPSDASSEAGLMMRESTAATARFVAVRVTAGEGVGFLQRATPSTAAVETATLPLASAPCWLRLVRSGTTYSAFYAADHDGTAGAWQAVGTQQTVAFAGTAHDIGMAVSSHVASSVGTATFDSLGGTVLLGGERTVTLTPVAGQSGITNVTLTSGDGTLTSTTGFTVIVDGAPPSTTVWNATTSGTLHWSTGSNWTGGVPPPSSRFSTIGFFTGQTLPAGTITSNNNTVGGHAMNVLTLGGTGPTSGTTTMSLAGNPLVFRRASLLDPSVNLNATNGTGFIWDVSAPVTMENSTTFQGAGTAIFHFGKIISGSGNLLKTGTGKLILAGENTYTGSTTVSGGTLQIGNDGASGSLPPGPVVNDATLRFDRTGTLLVPNDISGSGGITISAPVNTSTVVFSGSNSFTGGVNVSSGRLRITNSSALGSGIPAKNIVLNTGSTGQPQLRLDGSAGPIDLPATINFRTSHASGVITNEAGDNVLRGSITLISGGGDSGITVTAGSLRLTGPILSGYDEQRVLILGGAATGIVEGNISNGSSSARVVALRKQDGGLWTLTGSNTYTGATTLNAGTLRVNAPGSLGAGSAVTVNAATLGGDGVIGGSVTVNASGRLSPGLAEDSAGTLTIGGGLNISAMAGGTGKLVVELGPASDQVTVGGMLTIGTGALGLDDFIFTSHDGLTAGTYKLITSGGISGTLDPAKLTSTVGGFNATLRLNGNDLELGLVPSFATWQFYNGASGTMAGDHDRDGVPDGIEYFLDGPNANPTRLTVLPGVVNVGGILRITWTKGPGYAGIYGSDFVVETSDTLGAVWTPEPQGGAVSISGNDVTYTFPGGPGYNGSRRFARLVVKGP